MKAVLIQYEIIDTILAFAFLSHKYLIDILQTNRYNSDLFPMVDVNGSWNGDAISILHDAPTNKIPMGC